MEYTFEKDGKMKEKYISGANIIPYCADDFKKLMKDMEKDIDIECNKTISPAVCEIAYNFMQELIARPASLAHQFQNPSDALEDLKRNLRMKFPQLVEQTEKLQQEFSQSWQQQEEAQSKRSQEKAKQLRKIERVEKRPPKKEKTKKKSGKKQGKYQIKKKHVFVEKQQTDSDILEQEDLQQLLDYLSQDNFPES